MTFLEFLTNNKADSEVVALWNEFAAENGYETIYTDGLDEMAEELFHGRPADFARAVFFGNVAGWFDSYAVFNGYGNIVTFNYWGSANSPVDIDELMAWLEENNHPIYEEWAESGLAS